MGASREQLYQEVWAEPMITVAKRYDVSSGYLARICERLGVPCPARGYWQQLAAGTKRKRPALPPAAPGSELEWTRGGTRPRRQPLTLAATPPRKWRSKSDRPAMHPLLAGARAHFDHAVEDRSEVLPTEPSASTAARFASCKRRARDWPRRSAIVASARARPSWSLPTFARKASRSSR